MGALSLQDLFVTGESSTRPQDQPIQLTSPHNTQTSSGLLGVPPQDRVNDNGGYRSRARDIYNICSVTGQHVDFPPRWHGVPLHQGLCTVPRGVADDPRYSSRGHFCR